MRQPAISQPVLSVLIVSYNGRRVLEACLRSIDEKLTVAHEVIVSDNGSSDDTAAYLRAHFPRVQVIERPTNDGFAAATNRAATAATGEFLLLLNPDTLLTGDLADWVTILQRDPQIGVAGCRLSFASGRLQESIGLDVTFWRLLTMWFPTSPHTLGGGYLRLVAPRDDARYTASIVDVPWVSGAALLTRRTTWEDLHGMDAGYFMYFEDVAYCDRVRRRGHRVVYSASARITHLMWGGQAWCGPTGLRFFLVSLGRYARQRFGPAPHLLLSLVLPGLLVQRAAVYAVIGWLGGGKQRRAQAVAYLQEATGHAIGMLRRQPGDPFSRKRGCR